MKQKKSIIIIAIMLIAAVAAVYFFVSKDNAKGDATPTPVQYYNYAIADSFVTNVKDSSKLFKATIVLVVNKDGLDEFLASKEYIIRDAILFTLRDLTEEDIESEDIQDRLRISITDALNEKLEIDNIVSVYFNDFVMQ